MSASQLGNLFIQMANLTLLRRDAFLEHLKQGVKPDTFSALRNCPLNGYALFPDAVIRKAEDEIAQFESPKRTRQPGPGQGGFTGHKKLQQHRYQPYSTGWKNQDNFKPSGQSGKDMPAWKSFGDVADPRAEVISSDVVPEAPWTLSSINDNYCVTDPVARSMHVVGVVRDKNISVNAQMNVSCPVVCYAPSAIVSKGSRKRKT